jgi:hypothetical protein
MIGTVVDETFDHFVDVVAPAGSELTAARPAMVQAAVASAATRR